MAKKVNQTLKAHLNKNVLVEKGGAWMLRVTIQNEGSETFLLDSCTAWSNPSAAKRYLKQVVLDNTPRKSIKMEVTAGDVNEKPISIEGMLAYKVDA